MFQVAPSQAVYKAMKDQHVLLEGTLLKPSMVTPGKAWVGKVAPPAPLNHEPDTYRAVPDPGTTDPARSPVHGADKAADLL